MFEATMPHPHKSGPVLSDVAFLRDASPAGDLAGETGDTAAVSPVAKSRTHSESSTLSSAGVEKVSYDDIKRWAGLSAKAEILLGMLDPRGDVGEELICSVCRDIQRITRGLAE